MALPILPALLAQRSTRWAVSLSAAVGLCLCAVPLFGVLGVESAFVLGLCSPLIAAAHIATLHTAQRAGRMPLRGHEDLPGIIAGVALLHVGLPTLMLAANSLRIQQCEPAQGLLYIALGPGCGTLLATAWAALLAPLVRHNLARIGLCVLPPLLGLVAFAYSFYGTPAVFAYGHFFGYFPGSFYDRVVNFPEPLLWLRLGSLGLLGLVACLILGHRDAQAWSFHGIPRHPRYTLAAFAPLLLFALVHSQREELGYDTSAEHIQQHLGTSVLGERCLVYLPREYQDKAGFVQDCDVRVRQMEQFFGLRQPELVQVYLFRTAAEKRSLMGASHTNIAKPWRREVYVQQDIFPHPILAHEIAHIVIGNAGMGPFRITGRFFGLWPNPGVIEGMATAADPRPRGDLTPHQWARAAVEAKLAPPLSNLLGAGFFQQQTGLAYTLAGSFLLFMRAEAGRQALLTLYQTNDVQGAFAAPIAELERRWRHFLKNVELPSTAAALAKQRFSGDPVLSAVCPHRVAALKENLDRELRGGDLVAAEQQCRMILDVDPGDEQVAAARVSILARQGRRDEAEQALDELRQSAPTALTTMTDQALADTLVRRGELAAAAERYQFLLSQPQPAVSRRQLEVKLLALDAPPAERSVLLRLLVGEPHGGLDPILTMHLIRELRALRNDGLAHYLEGRQLYFAHHYDRAANLLGEALRLGLPTSTLVLEAEQLLGTSLVAIDELDDAQRLWTRLAEQADDAVRWLALDFQTRIRILKARERRGHPGPAEAHAL